MAPPSSSFSPPPRHVLIVGAGIHGLSTAYFLSTRHHVRCTLIERSGSIAPGASSKAAGFLARHWNDETPTKALTHRSFDLHQELADKLGADKINYRRLHCVGVQVDPSMQKERVPASSKKPKKHQTVSLEWRPHTSAVSKVSDMGDEANIAQVYPRLLCQQLWKACQETDLVTLRKGTVVGTKHNDHKLQGAILDDGQIVEGDALLYAAGAWVANIMYGIKGHSLILPTTRVLKQAIFFESKQQQYGDPEVFVRPDQTAFISGWPGDVAKVTEQAGSETIEEEVVERLKESVRACMGYETNDDAIRSSIAVSEEPIKVQACYQPTTEDFIPVMGKLSRRATDGADNVYIQGGHNCWGILLAPASGEAMASLMAMGKSSHVDLSPFTPGRFRNLKPVPQVP